MSPKLTMAGAVLVAGGLGGTVGFAFGQREGLQLGLRFLRSEVSGSLSMHVEAASSIRVGDTDKALGLLDQSIDLAVVSITAESGAQQDGTAIREAKLYRSVVPAEGRFAQDALDALRDVEAIRLVPGHQSRLQQLARGLGE